MSTAPGSSSNIPAPMRILSSWFPHVKHPLIVSAPMRAISGPELACAVTAAGGLGFIGAGWEYPTLSTDLSASRTLLNTPSNTPMPIGVGFLTADAPIDEAIPALLNDRPAAIWLSFPRSPSQHIEWIEKLKPSRPDTKIFVQVCSVFEAKEALEMGADALVVQGHDAGGHGKARSAGLISLLPEVCKLLRSLDLHDKIPLLAAGGITNGTGASAALALGAHGTVMGTRFVCSTESKAADGYKEVILKITDGGVNTVRTNLFDRLRGAIEHWPDVYNGRGIVNDSVLDDARGIEEAENKYLYSKAEAKGEFDRLTVFAGTGLGLVDKVQPAKEIVESTRGEVKAILQSTAALAAAM